ncbi:YfhO family protein [Candidatus Gottesmanbacteria bacterium]|nr:YfhO family protein [Candidatus Gottesmanbacteria bacterium]
MQKKHISIVLFLVVLTILVFWKSLLLGLIPFPGDYLISWYEPWKTDTFRGVPTVAHKAVADDVFRHLYPLRVLAFDILKQGQLPLWNPYNGSGTPLLAIMHPGYLNPFGFFFLFLPPPVAWIFFVGLQVPFLAFCTYLYCRQLRLNRLASLFAASILVFSGFVIVRLVFGEFIYALAMLPLLLLFVESALLKSCPSFWLFTPIAVSFLFLSGQPHIILTIVLITGIYAVFRGGFLWALRYLPFFLLGLGIAGVQLIPALELYRFSTITRISSEFIFQRFLLPVWHLISILIPNYFGNQATYNYWGAGDYIETVAAVGLIPCLFACIACIRAHKSFHVRFFFGVTIVSILLTLDWFGTRWFYRLPLPVLSADVPSRIFAFAAFGIAILSGFGLDMWMKTKRDILRHSFIRWFFAVIALIAFITTVLFILHPACPVVQIPNCWTISIRNMMLEIIVLILFMTAAIFYKKVVILPLLLVLLLGAYNSNKFLPFSSSDTVLHDNAVIRALKEHTRDARVFGMGEANLKTNFATHFHIYDPNYYDPLHLKRYAELIEYANKGKARSALPRSDVEIINDPFVTEEVLFRRNRLFDILGIRYLLFKKAEVPLKADVDTVWENDKWYLAVRKSALPRAYLVPSYEVISDDERLFARLFDPVFDVQNTVLLEKIPVLGSLEKKNGLKMKKLAVMKEYHEQNVIIETELDDTALLVVSDTFYPGWKALIDGAKTEIYRANYSFRAVSVPAGRHTVRFVYDPLSVWIGLLVTLGSLVFYVLMVIWYLAGRDTMQKSAKVI